jgi:mannose/fructose/N-acetylgalactosamine-specific phosphotransferase system component IIB
VDHILVINDEVATDELQRPALDATSLTTADGSPPCTSARSR